MRHQRRVGGDVADAPQPVVGRAELLEAEAEAVHAGVDLDPGRDDVRARVRFEHLELLETVHHQVEALLRGRGQLRGAEHALEQQDAVGEPRGAQCQAFLKASDREAVRLASALAAGTSPWP